MSIDEPSWLTTILISSFLSAFIGHHYSSIKGYLLYLISNRSINYFTGEWYGYYFILREGEELFCEENFTLTQSKFDPQKLILQGRGKTIDQVYNGYVKFEENFMLFTFNPSGHNETVFMRAERPIKGHDRRIVGLWSAWDFDNKAAVGSLVLTREPHEKEQIKEIILKKIYCNGDLRIMKIK